MAEPTADELFARIRAFEWDEEKRESNLRAHDIDFQDARQVIDGPTFIRQSDRKSETRYMSVDTDRGAGYGNTLTWTDKDKPALAGTPVEIQFDLDNEKFDRMFINLMTAQRNFQANSKVISTADEMMQEVMNIKRN